MVKIIVVCCDSVRSVITISFRSHQRLKVSERKHSITVWIVKSIFLESGGKIFYPKRRVEVSSKEETGEERVEKEGWLDGWM